ncbi:MAG: PASTA domain-containing protein [Paludibacteraceae bacterium]|nr:PASTA domain-containing protein [Paludibacteraceae bacterium]
MAEETKKKEGGKGASILKKIFLNPIVLSVLAMLLLGFIGIFFVRGWLDKYTHHGEEIEVPDLKGMVENDASELLSTKKLGYEIIDSTYARGFKPGAIVEQVPKAGSKVKEGRRLYLTVQAREAKKVNLPEVREGSARQAEATLNSIGIKVANLEYIPSDQAGNVIEVKYRDKVITPGYKIVEGSEVTLVIGRGLTNEEAVVPSFRGQRLETAKNTAHERNLNIGAIKYDADVTTDFQKENAFVYKQYPITGKTVPAGTRVDIFLSLNKNILEEPEEVFVDSTATQRVEGAEDGLWDN